jgi:hypothetical protein
MEIVQRTHDVFQDWIRVDIVGIETPTTNWVRIQRCSGRTEVLNREMLAQPMQYLPSSSFIPGMIVIVKVYFRTATFWDRAIILRQTMTGYTVFLISWRIEIELTSGSICLSPQTSTMMAPRAQEDSPTRRAGPSEPNAETSRDQSYYVEPRERIYRLRGPFSYPVYVRKVTVGPGAGRISRRRRRRLDADGLPRS